MDALTQRIVTASGNALPTDQLILCNSTSTISLNLPPSGADWRTVIISNAGTGLVIVSAPDNIGLTQKNYVLNQYDLIELTAAAIGSWGILRLVTGAAPSIKTVKKTIGAVGVTGCDFNFVTAANYTEQPIDLGAIVPAKARVLDVMTFTNIAFATCTTLVAETGNATSGAQFIASATIKAINVITAVTHALGLNNPPVAAASNIWVSATPDAGTTWAAITAGKLTVYVTYIDVTNI